MKNSIIAALVLTFALAVGANAQDAPKPKEHSMTGCLAKGDAPGTYKVTDVEKGPKTIGIVSSDVNLAPHVGHKIEVTGVAVPPKDAETDKNVPHADHYMKLSSIKMISPTCP